MAVLLGGALRLFQGEQSEVRLESWECKRSEREQASPSAWYRAAKPRPDTTGRSDRKYTARNALAPF